MKKHATQQEILLVTTSTFSQMQLCEKDNTERNQLRSQAELLEEACWNGLLNVILPEIMQKPGSGKKLILWHIKSGKSFLQLEFSEFPIQVEKEFSIVSDFYLSTIRLN